MPKKEMKAYSSNPPFGIKLIVAYLIILSIIDLFLSIKEPGLILGIIITAATIYLAISLWKGYPKARTILLVISYLGILFSLFYIFNTYAAIQYLSTPYDNLASEGSFIKIMIAGIIGIIITISIIWYLQSDKVKKFFKI